MKKWGGSFLGVLVLVAGILQESQAYAIDYAAQVQNEHTRYTTPETLIDKVPFLGEIPRTFLFGDGYKMKLSLKELRIDHMADHSHSPASRRDCQIGFSYTTPVAGFFTSRIDLPLFSAATPALSDWTRNSLGDYVAYFSKGASDSSTLRLVFSARF